MKQCVIFYIYYEQVDFVDPQRIAGIITKGREDVPQWVTAYTVDYSNDAIVWNSIKDDDGEVEVFICVIIPNPERLYNPFLKIRTY